MNVHERQFPLAFYGGMISKVDCKFSHWVTCTSQRKETTAAFKERWLSKRRDWH